MDERAQIHDEQLAQTLESSGKNVQHLKEKPYVTTITICVYLSHAAPDIEALIQVYESTSGVHQDFITEVFGGKEAFYPSRRTFMNSVIFTLKPNVDKATKVAIKCFKNGSLHITGVRTVQRALTIAQAFCVYYDLVASCNYSVTDFDVQMTNVHFSFDVDQGRFNLSEVFNIVLSSTEHECMYNNERHAGVIIKYLCQTLKKISIIIFESGNLLICAFCTSEEYKEAWDFITGFMNENWSKMFSLDVPMKSVKRTKSNHNDNAFDYGKYLVLK